MAKRIDNIQLYDKVALLIEQARKQVATTVNLIIVHTYFEIGRMIVEDEQDGKERAEYGKHVLQELAEKLTGKFGEGFSLRNLRNMRQFYVIYFEKSSATSLKSSSEIENSISSLKLLKNDNPDNQYNIIRQTPSAEFSPFKLGRSHYLILMRIENPDERSFYEIEAYNTKWSVSELKRQYNSSLYERLALSRDKEGVLKLASRGHSIENAVDILKNPLSLEFLGLEQKTKYTESDVETAIISKIQNFLLELGKGFLFEARQKRFSFQEKSFFVDLVFYNRLLQCYVLIDLKTDELKHQDLGQMQMYVNYYNRYVKADFEKPTIGILLVKDKDDALVKLTLPEDANIYASQYSLYLPEKQLLQQKLKQWINDFEEESLI